MTELCDAKFVEGYLFVCLLNLVPLSFFFVDFSLVGAQFFEGVNFVHTPG